MSIDEPHWLLSEPRSRVNRRLIRLSEGQETTLTQGAKRKTLNLRRGESFLEVRVGIEPTNKGFAGPGLTSWLPREKFSGRQLVRVRWPAS